MSASRTALLYFAGDVLATTLSSAMIALVTGLVVSGGWPHSGAMVMGMLAGMVLSVPCWLLAGIVLGMIEPMLQIMLGGMLAGMAGAMASTGSGFPGVLPLSALGALCGCTSSLAVGCVDRILGRVGGHE